MLSLVEMFSVTMGAVDSATDVALENCSGVGWDTTGSVRIMVCERSI